MAGGPGCGCRASWATVMAMTHFPDGAGGYAELVVIDAALVAPIGAAEAHRILEAGHAGGKIVLDVKGSLK
jgi:hypothetical protein